MNPSRLKKHAVSFKYALKGLYFVLSGQTNFKIHLAAAILVVLFGLYFGLSQVEWLVLTLTIFLVLICEALNTALELVTDGLKEHKKTQRDDKLIELAKDVAAGAVLLASLNAVIVGVIIFLPKLFSF